jgi:hypothetical protein
MPSEPTSEQLHLLAGDATLVYHARRMPAVVGQWPVMANAAGWHGWQAAAVYRVEDKRQLCSPLACAVLVVALPSPGHAPRWCSALLACWPC